MENLLSASTPPPPASRPSSTRSAPPPMPPGFNPRQTIPKEIYVAAMGMKLQKLPKPDPFTPCHMFFYGSLMDTEVLQSVLGLPDRPAIVKGEIKGFSMKMWGIYPTIIRSEEGKISGTVWKVDSESEFLRLQDYETDAYTWCLCDIEQEDGAVLHGCRTFCWAGDANSRDLSDGSFDLARYQKYFKASVIRK